MITRNCAKCNSLFETKYTVGRQFSYCKVCCTEKRKKDWIENKTKIAKSNRYSDVKNRYGLSKDDYEDLIKKQDGKCAICNSSRGTKYKWRALAIDHDHATGQVRGLLCQGCNTAIGMFKDDIELLNKAISYLNNFKKIEK
jgi:hypothetical protein